MVNYKINCDYKKAEFIRIQNKERRQPLPKDFESHPAKVKLLSLTKSRRPYSASKPFSEPFAFIVAMPLSCVRNPSFEKLPKFIYKWND